MEEDLSFFIKKEPLDNYLVFVLGEKKERKPKQCHDFDYIATHRGVAYTLSFAGGHSPLKSVGKREVA